MARTKAKARKTTPSQTTKKTAERKAKPRKSIKPKKDKTPEPESDSEDTSEFQRNKKWAEKEWRNFKTNNKALTIKELTTPKRIKTFLDNVCVLNPSRPAGWKSIKNAIARAIKAL